jgi:hypothetical protein
MKRLSISAIITMFVFGLASCDDIGINEIPGASTGSDFRLRSLLDVNTLGGRYQTPPGARSAALIVHFFENGKQVGRGQDGWRRKR